MSETPKQSQKTSESMGAIPSDNGSTFRVWAPHADKISVVGNFNDWQEDKHLLNREENGYWAVYVPEARAQQEYKYIIYNGNDRCYKNDPYTRKIGNGDGNSIIYRLDYERDDINFKMPDWHELVIYELHVGTFFSATDGKMGDFSGVEKKLKYLKDLGINAIEIMPISEFPGIHSLGYNLNQPFAIEKDYGGPDAFAKLVNTAHAMGIAIIMDVVFNHWGPSDLDLWQFDGWSENRKGGIYFYNDERSHTPWGDTRPNYGRKEVRRYIRDYVFMWLENYHCDGLRVDATNYIRHISGGGGESGTLEDGIGLLKEIISEIKATYPSKLLIAEDMQSQNSITRPIAEGGIGFDTQWDANFVHPVRNVLQQSHDEDRCLQSIMDALAYTYEDDVFKRVIFCESHDEVAKGKSRLPEAIQPGNADSQIAKKLAVLGAVLAFTAPGIPMIFQGQEFLIPQYFKDDETLDWSKLEEFNGIHCLYRDLIRIRTSQNSLYKGLQGATIDIIHFNQKDQILAYQRRNQNYKNNKLIVVVNLSQKDYTDYTIGLDTAGLWKLVFNSSSKNYDTSYCDLKVMDFEAREFAYDGKPYSGTFCLPCYTALIFVNAAGGDG